MAQIEKSIEVNVPARTAYNQWTQFEDFPRFMEGVKQVRQLDARTLEWHAEIGGKDVSWTSVITEQEPDRRISWQSTGGAANSGTVTFEDLGDGRTRVALRIDYEPEGALQSTGSAFGVVSARVAGDLHRFKEFIESRGRETGAWRGEIRGGQIRQPGAGEIQAGE
jgi:uncharacterized membrane protein